MRISDLPSVWWVGFGLYLVNIGVGIAAQFGIFRIGKAHHLLYFLVFLSALGAFFAVLHPLQLLTVSALLYMPLTRPPSLRHPIVALLGLFGYLFVLLSVSF